MNQNPNQNLSQRPGQQQQGQGQQPGQQQQSVAAVAAGVMHQDDIAAQVGIGIVQPLVHHAQHLVDAVGLPVQGIEIGGDLDIAQRLRRLDGFQFAGIRGAGIAEIRRAEEPHRPPGQRLEQPLGGVQLQPHRGRGLRFADPWGNEFEIVEYGDVPRSREYEERARALAGREPATRLRWAMGEAMPGLLGRVDPAEVRRRLAARLGAPASEAARTAR